MNNQFYDKYMLFHIEFKPHRRISFIKRCKSILHITRESNSNNRINSNVMNSINSNAMNNNSISSNNNSNNKNKNYNNGENIKSGMMRVDLEQIKYTGIFKLHTIYDYINKYYSDMLYGNYYIKVNGRVYNYTDTYSLTTFNNINNVEVISITK